MQSETLTASLNKQQVNSKINIHVFLASELDTSELLP